MTTTTPSNVPTEPNEKLLGIPCVEAVSLRDYFAAKAMQAMIPITHGGTSGEVKEKVAVQAYRMADEMMRIRDYS